MHLIILLLLAAAPVGEEPVMDTLVEVDPIIVVGQRVPQRLSRSVNSAISIGAGRMQNASSGNIIEQLSAAFASVTTTAVSGTGYGLGPRGQGKLLIRGLGFAPNRGTLVLIDGRPDIAGLFGHPLPDTYRRAGLLSAELVKGSASTLYGSNAVAGVLNLTSFYRPDRQRYSEAEVSSGRYGTLDGFVRHSQRVGRAVAAGWVEYLESDNHRDNSEYFNRSGGIRFQYEVSERVEFFVSGQYSSFDFSDPGPVYAPSRQTGDIRRMGLTTGLDGHGGSVSYSMRIYSSYGEHVFSNGFNSIDRNNGLDLFLRARSDFDPVRVSWSGGVSVNYLGGSAYNGSVFIRGGDFHEYEYAGHAQAELKYQRWLNLTFGGRYINHERYGGHFVYQAGAVISPERLGSFKLSWATSYRNPTVSETQLFLSSNDSTLAPEYGSFYELGYFNRFGRSLSIEAAVFKRDGKNLIEEVSNPNPPPMTMYANAGSYDHWGWEATVRFSTGGWSVSPSYLHLNQDSYTVSVPEDKLALTAAWDKGQVHIGLDASAAFRTHADSAGTAVILSDYAVVNLRAGYGLSELVELKGRIDNLFDEKYELVHGYPMPGLRYRLSLALTM